ncbi:MAG: MBL fold metallo-hydrolase [Granulosicoccus sp.]
MTSTIVESETGAIIVDVSFELTEASTSSTELREYVDALNKPVSVIITHAHRDHYGNIGSFADTNVYAETKNAAALLIDPGYNGLFSGSVNPITGSTEIAGLDVVFDNVSNTEARENGFIDIPSTKALFLGDLIFNRSHGFIREYTPLDDIDELDIWIAALTDAKTRFADYNYVFIGHTGYRSDVSVVLDENIDYLRVSQGLIKGTKELSAGGIATSVQDVTDELTLLYPDYKPGGLRLALPNGFFPGDPGANWF